MLVLETPTARSTDPITSFQAADGITTHQLTELQQAIVTSLSDGPLTHDELVLKVHGFGIHRTPQRVRSCCAELVRAGLVEPADELGRSMQGGKSQKWRLTL